MGGRGACYGSKDVEIVTTKVGVNIMPCFGCATKFTAPVSAQQSESKLQMIV